MLSKYEAYYTGDLVLVDLSNNIGHQQGGKRPAVIVSNNVGNAVSPMVEVLPLTTKRNNSELPTHVTFKASEVEGLKRDSTVEAESKWVINKWQILKKLGTFNDEQLDKIATAMVYATPIVIKAFQAGVHNTDLLGKFQIRRWTIVKLTAYKIYDIINESVKGCYVCLTIKIIDI